MTYQETLDYLYQNLPMFQRVGAVAYKKDLTNTLALCEALGNPHLKFKSIHIAGTNGKGSSSHMLASILQSAGYKTGLYTSPHLKEFTERIRINGIEVSKEFVVDFVARIKPNIEIIKPSFFEITVVMAFDYFAQQKVDIAVVEVGLGGRLDSTNVITPIVSLITNISWDHTDILGVIRLRKLLLKRQVL
jgi:dihydrofolate synthase / folylpolyglutamate synthase